MTKVCESTINHHKSPRITIDHHMSLWIHNDTKYVSLVIEVSSAPFDPLATASPTQSPTEGWGVGGKVRENQWRNRLFGYASKLWAFFAYNVSWSPKNARTMLGSYNFNNMCVSGSCSRPSLSATLFVDLFDTKLVDCFVHRLGSTTWGGSRRRGRCQKEAGRSLSGLIGHSSISGPWQLLASKPGSR